MDGPGYWSKLEEIAVAEAMRWAMRLNLPQDLLEQLKPSVERRPDGLNCWLRVRHVRLPFQPFMLVNVLVSREGAISNCAYAVDCNNATLEIRIRQKTGLAKGKVHTPRGLS